MNSCISNTAPITPSAFLRSSCSPASVTRSPNGSLACPASPSLPSRCGPRCVTANARKPWPSLPHTENNYPTRQKAPHADRPPESRPPPPPLRPDCHPHRGAGPGPVCRLHLGLPAYFLCRGRTGRPLAEILPQRLDLQDLGRRNPADQHARRHPRKIRVLRARRYGGQAVDGCDGQTGQAVLRPAQGRADGLLWRHGILRVERGGHALNKAGTPDNISVSPQAKNGCIALCRSVFARPGTSLARAAVYFHARSVSSNSSRRSRVEVMPSIMPMSMTFC